VSFKASLQFFVCKERYFETVPCSTIEVTKGSAVAYTLRSVGHKHFTLVFLFIYCLFHCCYLPYVKVNKDLSKSECRHDRTCRLHDIYLNVVRDCRSHNVLSYDKR